MQPCFGLAQAIEDLTAQLFSTHPHFEADRAILGASDTDRARLLKAALHQQWTGVAEYSPQFFSVYRACSRWAVAGHRRSASRLLAAVDLCVDVCVSNYAGDSSCSVHLCGVRSTAPRTALTASTAR